MKLSGKAYAMLFGLLLAGSGCTDKLGSIDLSGEVELHPSNQGWAYKTVATGELNHPRIIPHSKLWQYRDGLLLEKPVFIGNEEYMLVTRFTPGFSFRDVFIDEKNQPLKDFQTLVYSFSDHRLVKTFVSRQTDDGNDWNSRIDDGPTTHDNRRILQRDGLFHAVYHEPKTDKDCLIESVYSLKSIAELQKDPPAKETDGKPGPPPAKPGYEKVRIEGSSEIRIGFRQCLTGEKSVNGEQIVFHILDWDLDGKFTQDDVVWNKYTEKMLNFGVPLRLTGSFRKSKDNTYILKLIKKVVDSQEINVLKIELVKEGKK